MKKREWIIVIAPLLATWLLDRVTKMWANGLVGFHDHGFIGFILHHNHGAMLGLFSDLPPVLRIVSLSTGGAFLIFSYFLIQYLLPIRSLILCSGMSILLGGILGNVSDRIVWGYVIDFLIFKSSGYNSPAMNIADILQWLGYGMIVYALVKEGKILWPEFNTRKSYWVNAKYQVRYCLTLSAFGAALSIIAGVFSYTYFRVSLKSIPYTTLKLQQQYLMPYILTFTIISISFCIVLFFVGLMLSHRAAGPVYAFESFIKDLMRGKNRRLKFRTGDEFTHLEEIAEEMQEFLIEKGVLSNDVDEKENINDNNKKEEIRIEEG